MTEAAIDPLAVKDGEIPLPPPEMWADLDNSSVAAGAAEVGAPLPVQRGPSVAVLEFIGEKKPHVAIPLVYPFKFNGLEVREIVVRRLTVQQIGDFWDALPEGGSYDRSDVFGLMCGLSGAVFRALPDPDGQKVLKACVDFLPRELGGESD